MWSALHQFGRLGAILRAAVASPSAPGLPWIVLLADSTPHTVPNPVRAADGTSYTAPAAVLLADGTSYTPI
jgi:hypothetical protein